MDEQDVRKNDASRERLRELVARLDDEMLQRPLDDEWTVGATLAHLAFWDQICVARWDVFAREGAFAGLSGEVIDLINAANLPTWRALPGSVVKPLVLQAAEEIDARTASLTDAALAYARRGGRTFILNRWNHRTEHLDQIEALLGP